MVVRALGRLTKFDLATTSRGGGCDGGGTRPRRRGGGDRAVERHDAGVAIDLRAGIRRRGGLRRSRFLVESAARGGGRRGGAATRRTHVEDVVVDEIQGERHVGRWPRRAFCRPLSRSRRRDPPCRAPRQARAPSINPYRTQSRGHVAAFVERQTSTSGSAPPPSRRTPSTQAVEADARGARRRRLGTRPRRWRRRHGRRWLRRRDGESQAARGARERRGSDARRRLSASV